jgi:ParB/RepB/Spo0J family partition protein
MEILQLDAEKIVVAADRVRKEFDKEKLQRLASSFKKLGQIQPGVCIRLEDGSFQLVAGERRLRACRIAGIPFLFILKEEASKLMLLEIEIEENVNREGLTWQEEVEGLERLHSFREGQKADKGQTQSLDDTALETDRARSSVHRDLEIAEWSKEFGEIKAARTKEEAWKIIKRYKAELLRNQLLQQAIGKDGGEEIEAEPSTGTPQLPECVVVSGVTIPKKLLLDFDNRVILGRMEEQLKRFEDETINLVLFDPPWGVNLSQVSNTKGGTDEFEDSEEVFTSNIESWLRQLYAKMSVDSHLYLFFGIRFHELAYLALESAGFTVNRIPLIWYKQGSHVTRNPEIWPGRSYEPIAFARKGNRKLITLGSPDVIITPAPTPAMKGIHPSAKHPDIYLELLKRSAYPGDKVLDPMAGSGMMAVAAEEYRASKRLDWWLIEEKQSFRELALENIIRGYNKVVNREPIDQSALGHQYDGFSELISEDFHVLEPGSSEWMKFWKAHPEAQEQMLDWKKSQELGVPF